MPEFLGKSPVTFWNIFSFQAVSPDADLSVLNLPTPYFVCLLDWDAAAASDAQIDALARRLLDAGAVMLCCRGEDSARVCERFAAVIGGRESGVARSEISVRDLPGLVPEAVAFVLDGACPAPRYLAQCAAVLALVIGADVYRLAMVELPIATHLLRGGDPPGAPGVARLRA